MKKIVIGRNNSCDIIISDPTHTVSRKQAVLVFRFPGGMELYDTSNNGTYVNGIRLENGKGMKVTRKDRITFANAADLDWDSVKDPYRTTKILSAVVSVLIILFVVIGLLLFLRLY